jgi:hypothetical protein
MEPAPGERFEVDWGHFGVLDYLASALARMTLLCSPKVIQHPPLEDAEFAARREDRAMWADGCEHGLPKTLDRTLRHSARPQ